jgi:flagellar hook-associated protein 2
MASTSSISGLVSGLDTAALVDQLMTLEAASQNRLKARVTSEQTGITALQSLNTKVAALGTKAAALAKAATWSAVTATSSNTSVTVNALAGAAPTRLGVTVTSVASTHQLGFANAAALTDHVTGTTNKVALDRFDGTPVEIDSGDGTLQGLVTAINDPLNATGLHASAVKTNSGYRLLVESDQTGAAQDFNLTAADGSALLGGATVRAGTDASIDLGLGITVGSSTNTFADLVPGVTLTLASDTAVGAVSTVEVKRGSTTLGTSVADLVASMNTILAEIDKGTAYDSTAKTSGVLGGDTGARNLRTAIIGTVFSTSGESLTKLGLNTTRDGKIVFDATAFAAAYAADPDGTAAKFTTAANGFAARVQTVAKAASDPTDGNITAAITGRRTGVTRLQTSIEGWDIRLAQRRITLNRQFTALETAMSQMNSQSSWLSSQLASLPSNSSSNN